jgi:hypothetical protein
MKRKGDDHEEKPGKKARFRPKDVIHECQGMPRLPPGGCIVSCISCDDLESGNVTRIVVWDPNRCAHGARKEVRELLCGTSRQGSLTEALYATWQYFAGGPTAVKKWDALPERWKRLTRSELGFVRVEAAMARVLFISDESDGEESELSTDGDEIDSDNNASSRKA